MLRTQIQLPENEYQELRETALRMNRSISDCIRQGIAMFLAQAKLPGDDFSDIAGKFSPSHTELEPHDVMWAEAILASKRAKDGQ